MKTILPFCFLSVSILLVALTGCNKGPVVYTVTGTVYLDDQPLPDARVIFTPQTLGGKETDAAGKTDENGVYKIQTITGKVDGGTTPGDYIVSFSKMKILWDGQSYLPGPTPDSPPVKNSRSTEELAPIYTSQRTSPERATVTTNASKNQFDFHLKTNP